jgi:hypothetical protein
MIHPGHTQQERFRLPSSSCVSVCATVVDQARPKRKTVDSVLLERAFIPCRCAQGLYRLNSIGSFGMPAVNAFKGNYVGVNR